MKELKFNSQICTTIEQSKHLLDLGLKPETADMYYFWLGGNDYYLKVDIDNNPLKYNINKTYFPAWSLHRLKCLLPTKIPYKSGYLTTEIINNVNLMFITDTSEQRVISFIYENLYESMIKCIKWLIKEDYFNKEYLKQKDKHRKQLRISPNKFDITALKPFDKVLVRDADGQNWAIEFYEHFDEKHKDYVCAFSCYAQCIPYEENKHLLNTANACDKFYKTWE